jgi:anti-sigma factor RsiW
MNLQRFEELAGAYGADIARWPAAEQDSARALAAQDTRARAALARGAQLDALLHEAAVPVDDDAALRIVQRSLQRAPPREPSLRGWWRVWPSALLVGAALAGCATARERPQWLGLPQAEPAHSALADAFDADGSRF